ncbi:MAG: hypothetical protein V2A63_01225 [Patescibacteria group bacterium]
MADALGMQIVRTNVRGLVDQQVAKNPEKEGLIRFQARLICALA